MKEQMQSKLVEILTSIQSAAGKASDFAMEQLPDIAQSYVAYGRVVETAQFLMVLAAFICLLFVSLKYGYLNREALETSGYDKGDWKAHRVAAAVFGSIGAFLSFTLLMLSLSSMVMVWLAPKVWLLKALARMVQ